MSMKHSITLPSTEYSGTVEVSQAKLTVEMPVGGSITGTLKHYVLDLKHKSGSTLKLELSKDPNGNWFDMFLFKKNDHTFLKEIEEAKIEINNLGI